MPNIRQVVGAVTGVTKDTDSGYVRQVSIRTKDHVSVIDAALVIGSSLIQSFSLYDVNGILYVDSLGLHSFYARTGFHDSGDLRIRGGF